MDLISIIIPVYNSEKYLKRCFDSVVNQTYKNLEIILVDDGSQDLSPEICDEFARLDPRIRVIHKENGGASTARNAGLGIAKGDFIGFVDSDDWIDHSMYEIMRRHLLEHMADVCDVGSLSTATESEYKNRREKISIKEEYDILIDFFKVDRYSCCRKLYRREVIGNFRFPSGKIGEDVLFNFQVLSNSKRIVKSSLILYYYFSNPRSVSGSLFKRKDFDLYDSYKYLVENSKGNPDVNELAKARLAVVDYSIIGRYIKFDIEQGFSDAKIIIDDIHRNLRRNIRMIVKSNISIKKKCLIVICAVFNPHFLRRIYQLN